MNWLPPIAVALTLGAPGPKEAPKKADPPGIVGEWQCVEFVAGGRPAPAIEPAGIRLEFTADGKLRVRWGEDVTEERYTTDPSKDPAELDYGSKRMAAPKNKAIYKVEKDTLLFCVTEGGGDRPAKFEAPGGTRIMLLTFTRVEKKKE